MTPDSTDQPSRLDEVKDDASTFALARLIATHRRNRPGSTRRASASEPTMWAACRCGWTGRQHGVAQTSPPTMQTLAMLDVDHDLHLAERIRAEWQPVAGRALDGLATQPGRSAEHRPAWDIARADAANGDFTAAKDCTANHARRHNPALYPMVLASTWLAAGDRHVVVTTEPAADGWQLEAILLAARTVLGDEWTTAVLRASAAYPEPPTP